MIDKKRLLRNELEQEKALRLKVIEDARPMSALSDASTRWVIKMRDEIKA